MLYSHYINALAPWYDLHDPRRTFGTIVAEQALQVPILFRAIVALSASHLSKTAGLSSDVASAFHSQCVADMLRSMDSSLPSLDDGSYLASTCLLRSFELINGKFVNECFLGHVANFSSGGSNEESHLLGAYSYAVSQPIDFSETGIHQAGAWNYLREEITAGLIQRREVRLGQIFDTHVPDVTQHDELFNDICYLLARIVNFCFAENAVRLPARDRQLFWLSLSSDLETWKHSLPPSFQPYSTAAKPENPFPSLWMLRPWHGNVPVSAS